MESTRQQKVSRLIQKELASIFQQQNHTLFEGAMITVTIVRISADLSVAKTYISIFPSEKVQHIFALVQTHQKKIRNQLAQKIRHQLKNIPELIFYIDDSIDYADRINKLLNS